ncbi:AAA family ATPase [Streptomyces microflavus]|uniref:AAA family ATPase n=1 Tax=Streptomyces microflavus TaxID=1919 RepID=UPI0034081D2A
MTTLRSFQVDQLLGEFNHKIHFNAEKEFVILHGPNGVGKTKLLELLSATLSFDIFRISEVQFAKLSLNFDDGVELTVINNSERSGSSIDLT